MPTADGPFGVSEVSASEMMMMLPEISESDIGDNECDDINADSS